VAQRIDKWLVYARFVKHRAKAQALIEQGQVRINRERVSKISQAVKPNDILTLAIEGHVKVVRVLAEAERRGPPSSATGLYESVAKDLDAHGLAAEKQGAQVAPLC
jgi:ribosome-associated heat shock protein Hsp15